MDKKQENVVLLHGRWPERFNGTLIQDIPLCDPNNEGNWMGWTKKKLLELGYEAACPIIENAWKAPYSEWKAKLDETRIDERTTLVGWSAGGGAILRYLSESGKRVKKVILVAPGSKYTSTDADPLPSKAEFYGEDILPSLRAQIQNGTTILVSNDSPEILKSVRLYRGILNASVVELEGRGHFSFLIPELPELLDEITHA